MHCDSYIWQNALHCYYNKNSCSCQKSNKNKTSMLSERSPKITLFKKFYSFILKGYSEEGQERERGRHLAKGHGTDSKPG